MPRPYFLTGKQGEGHYGRGIGDIDITQPIDLSSSPFLDNTSVNLNATAWGQAEGGNLPTLTGGGGGGGPVNATTVGTWLQQNGLIVIIGALVGLFLFRKS
jgi:hypothetical protein